MRGPETAQGRAVQGVALVGSEARPSDLVGDSFPGRCVPDVGTGCAGSKAFSLHLEGVIC